MIGDITYLTISMDRTSIKPREQSWSTQSKTLSLAWINCGSNCHKRILIIPVKLLTQYLLILNKLIMTTEIKHCYGWRTLSQLTSYLVAGLWRRPLYLDPILWRRKWVLRHCNATMLVREWKVYVYELRKLYEVMYIQVGRVNIVKHIF